MHTYLRLLNYLKGYYKKLLVIFLLTICLAITSGASLGMIYPLFQGMLSSSYTEVNPITKSEFIYKSIDVLKGQNLLSKKGIEDSFSQIKGLFLNLPRASGILLICIVTLILIIIKNLFTFLQSYCMVDLEQSLARGLRNQIFGHIQELSLQFFATRRAGDIISRITNDVNALLAAVAVGFGSFVRESLLLVIYLVIVISTSPDLALFSLLTLPVASIAIFVIGRRLRKKSERLQRAIADVQTSLFENYLGIRIVKAFVMEGFEKTRFASKTMNEYKANMAMVKVNAATGPITEVLGSIVAIGVIFYGAYLITTTKTLSVGQFFLFLAALLSMMQPIKRLGEVNNLVQRGISAGIRFFEIMDISSDEPDNPNPVHVPQGFYEISFRNVSFAYREGIEVLHRVSFNIDNGKVLAIAGPSGAGKSTLVDLIPRFYYPNDGDICLDNTPISWFDLKEWRKQIGMVTQETILFHDTIYNNLTYGSSDISMDMVIEAAKTANALDFIQEMPQGFDTIIGERGVLLSGGQKQRLAIARALIKDPPILILDEATSALDSESEYLVQEAIERLIRKRTTFVIAHRLSTIQHADLIIVLDKGKIVQTGTHGELIEEKGMYKDLYELQFKGKKP